MPFGAECLDDGRVRFRFWTPKASHVNVLLGEASSTPHSASFIGDGWFELVTSAAKAGDLYQFQVDGAKVPDPASRFQPDDVHGPSQIIAPNDFEWNDAAWKGRRWEEAVLYELHVGTFTPEGTFAGVESKLHYLKELGVTAIELMPVSDFPGARSWGYDGVLPFAPDSSYGTPDDLKRLVQEAHAVGLMIFLDVVYNHFGPDGNYLHQSSPDFFTNSHHTPWGDAINFANPTVHRFFIENALYWLEEFNLDGLRLDAVHAIVDDSRKHFLIELAEEVHQQFPLERHVHLVLENDDNNASYLSRDESGKTKWYDAQWNDDIHHIFHVIVSGETDGYYSDYINDPISQLGRCLTEGFAYQGEMSRHRNARRGESSKHLPPQAFVSFLQNHDQVGNRALGGRLSQIADPQALRAAISILLVTPSVPLLFMGEEFAASTPFLYFCDFQGELADAVTKGRRSEFASFARFGNEGGQSQIPDPNDSETFLRSKLKWEERDGGNQSLKLYVQLLALRKKFIIPLLTDKKPSAHFAVTGKVLSANWKFEQSTLSLGTNLSASAAPFVSDTNTGHIIYSTENERASVMSPWSVIWRLQS
jgi:maltooligosyltrehalose trehalohydrolase